MVNENVEILEQSSNAFSPIETSDEPRVKSDKLVQLAKVPFGMLVGLNTTVLRLIDDLNVSIPIVVTLDGIVAFVKLIQLLKIPLPIDVTLVGIFISCRPEYKKTKSFIVVIVVGIVIDVSEPQFENMLLGKVLIPLPIVIDSSDAHFEKTPSPILVTALFIVTATS